MSSCLDDMYAAKESAQKGVLTNSGGVMRPLPINIALGESLYFWRYRDVAAWLEDPSISAELTPPERRQLLQLRFTSSKDRAAYTDNTLRTTQLASVGTALSALSDLDRNNLVNMGYLASDLAVLERLVLDVDNDANRRFLPNLASLPKPAALREIFPGAFSAAFALPKPIPACLTAAADACPSNSIAKSILRLE